MRIRHKRIVPVISVMKMNANCLFMEYFIAEKYAPCQVIVFPQR